MVGVADASVKEGNQVFRDIVVLGLVAVVPVLLVAGEEVVHGEVDVQIGALELADDQIPGAALQNALGLSDEIFGDVGSGAPAAHDDPGAPARGGTAP